jgi:hypothetical protein
MASARITLTVADMAVHIDQLAAEHDVAVTWRDSGSNAYTDQRRIAIRPVRSEVTYAVALHELGHILAEGGRGRFWMDLDAEVCAWEWALRNADTVGPRFRAAVRRGLQSHYDWMLCKRDCIPRTLSFQAYLAARNGLPSLPPSDSRFWPLLRKGCLCPEAHEGTCQQ